MADEDRNDDEFESTSAGHSARDHDPEPDDGPAHEPDEDGPGPDEINPLVDPVDDEGNEKSPEDVIDPDDGTARADALFGADEVDEALGDDAPARPERGDTPGSTTRAPGLSEDEVDEDDDDLEEDSFEARERARRDAFVDQVLDRQEAIRSAYAGGPRIHPASSARGRVTADGSLAFHRDEDGDAVCDVCGSVLDEDEEGNVIHPEDEEHEDGDGNPDRQSAARHDSLHTEHPEGP